MGKNHWHTLKEYDQRLVGLLAAQYALWLRSAKEGDFATAQVAGRRGSEILGCIRCPFILERAREIGWWVYETTQADWERHQEQQTSKGFQLMRLTLPKEEPAGIIADDGTIIGFDA